MSQVVHQLRQAWPSDVGGRGGGGGDAAARCSTEAVLRTRCVHQLA